MKQILISLLCVAFLVGCTVPETVTQPDGSVVTNQVPDPRLTETVATIGAINDVSAPVNPYAGLIKIVLGATTAGASVWASIATWFSNRNKKFLAVAVKGVEAAGSPETKSAIEAKAADAGVKLEFDAAVQKIVN